MVNPPRITIPDGVAGWPDIEVAMVTLLDDLLGKLDPPGYACIVPPPDYEQRVNNGTAIVTVQRAGGAAERVVDHPTVFITVTTAYRSDSWKVLGWLRPQLHNFSGQVTNPDGSVAIINSISDLRGPQRVPDLSDDLRRVSQGFTVATRLDR
jgi:hypothetical protein